MQDRDFDTEELEKPRKARKQRDHKAADKYYSDDGYSIIRKMEFKKRRQEQR
jgi:hypothetical protein